MGVTIRTADEGDAEALRVYAMRLFAEKLPGIFERPAPTLDDELTFIRDHLEPANSTLLVAEQDGAIAGTVGVMGEKLAQEAHVATIGISVDRQHRGRGIGSDLLDAAVAWARTHGVTRLQLFTWENNPRAAELYRRHGFQEEGRLRRAIMDRGTPIDVIVMARLLDE